MGFIWCISVKIISYKINATICSHVWSKSPSCYLYNLYLTLTYFINFIKSWLKCFTSNGTATQLIGQIILLISVIVLELPYQEEPLLTMIDLNKKLCGQYFSNANNIGLLCAQLYKSKMNVGQNVTTSKLFYKEECQLFKWQIMQMKIFSNPPYVFTRNHPLEKHCFLFSMLLNQNPTLAYFAKESHLNKYYFIGWHSSLFMLFQLDECLI
jgi:hypothetical protein